MIEIRPLVGGTREDAIAIVARSIERDRRARAAFEAFFAWARGGRGRRHVPTFELGADGNYLDSSTQRHWWTWQQAQAHALGMPLAFGDNAPLPEPRDAKPAGGLR